MSIDGSEGPGKERNDFDSRNGWDGEMVRRLAAVFSCFEDNSLYPFRCLFSFGLKDGRLKWHHCLV